MLYCRGAVWNSLGAHDKAIEDYGAAIRLSPQSVPSLVGRGIAWRNKGNYDKAIEDLTAAVELDPKSVAAISAGRGLGAQPSS